MKVILWSKFKETTRREDEISDKLKQTIVLSLTPSGREAKLQRYPHTASSTRERKCRLNFVFKAGSSDKRIENDKKLK